MVQLLTDVIRAISVGVLVSFFALVPSHGISAVDCCLHFSSRLLLVFSSRLLVVF